MRYRFLVVYEQGDHNYSAYVPDLPGCVSTGATLGETREHIREAIALHLAGMREDGSVALPPALHAYMGTDALAR